MKLHWRFTCDMWIILEHVMLNICNGRRKYPTILESSQVKGLTPCAEIISTYTCATITLLCLPSGVDASRPTAIRLYSIGEQSGVVSHVVDSCIELWTGESIFIEPREWASFIQSLEMLWQSIDSCEAFNISLSHSEFWVELRTRRKSVFSNDELWSSIVLRSPGWLLLSFELSLGSGDVISQLSEDDANEGDGVSFVIERAASWLLCIESSHSISSGTLLGGKVKIRFKNSHRRTPQSCDISETLSCEAIGYNVIFIFLHFPLIQKFVQ